ncbi:SLC13 family permease [Flammeovirga agarivorans]|uniref:DASS family sodium-coupled anion symporter n=1 Tax=Flammeovirga agarivorans TaxID=2726742 RepID=A0A7X8XXX7_9BACT|nr:DASS family sodium-coupled anion symporter [Flammeovirga agarivorans]NLR93558.1 DASS family sodium-coupled anion symporter [Flammeovirga agarivorans]
MKRSDINPDDLKHNLNDLKHPENPVTTQAPDLAGYSLEKKIGGILGPLLFILIKLLPLFPDGITNNGITVIALAAWMLVWWVTETVPLAVTALLPLVVFPFFDVLSIKATAAPYANPIIFLFMGGFIVALAMEKWKLHLRIALSIVKVTGTSANQIILGFMLATAFLSMWISNTATTVMMLPIATSIILLLSSNNEKTPEKNKKNFAISMMLGIAYAASIGGIATLIGTPPNAIFGGFMKETYNIEIDFFRWMLIGIPFSSVMMVILYFVLTKLIYPNHLKELKGGKELIEEKYNELGPMGWEEKSVAIVFVLSAFLWTFRSLINQYAPIQLNDSSIAIFVSVLLFIIPTNQSDGTFILAWKDTEKLPWGVLVLFGGGLSMASALGNAGVIEFLGEAISNSTSIQGVFMMLLLITIMLFATEVMSNTALATIFLPVVGGVAVALGHDVLTFAAPVAMAASCAFMLPMATPPNAIVFASGHITVKQMVRIGIILNIISVLLLTLLSQTLVPIVFNG